jgi:protein BCP1
LADLIIAEPRIGTTIKCDGEESDPYAVMTVVNMSQHRVCFIEISCRIRSLLKIPAQDHAAVKALSSYALFKTAPNTSFNTDLQALLDPSSPAQLGFVFSERLINMPVQVMPALYRILAEELSAASTSNVRPLLHKHVA